MICCCESVHNVHLDLVQMIFPLASLKKASSWGVVLVVFTAAVLESPSCLVRAEITLLVISLLFCHHCSFLILYHWMIGTSGPLTYVFPQ